MRDVHVVGLVAVVLLAVHEEGDHPVGVDDRDAAILDEGGRDARLGGHIIGERRIAVDRDREGVKSASVDVGDERLGPAELGITRRQLLPDVKQAQVSCVAIVGRDGVIVAIRVVHGPSNRW